MISRRILPLVVVVFLTMLSSCSGSIGGSSSLQKEVDVLKMQVADLRDNTRPADPRSGQSGLSPDMRLEVDNLRLAVQKINENIETASLGGLSIRQQLEYLSARLDRLENKAGLKPLSQDIVQPNPPVPVAAPVLSVPPVVAPAALPGGAPAAPPVPPALPGAMSIEPDLNAPADVPAPVVVRTAYDEGKDEFDRKNYQVALTRFKDYLSAEPKGNQAAAAQFYIGESFYFQNKYEDAILEYQTLVSGYPKNSLVSSALLKQGLSFQALGDNQSAKLLYQKIVREFSKSYSAGVAKERLKTL